MKLKDIINEDIGGLVDLAPLGGMKESNSSLLKLAKAIKSQKEEKKILSKEELVGKVNEFSSYGPSIYKKHNLAEVGKVLASIAEAAQVHVVDETKDWFDAVTVKRNMGDLKKQSTQFNKIANEAQALQDRMAALYEDMGGILNRYFDIQELKEEE
mgnify:CR=1 FL=1|tara:strand:- start:46 stop:513 length:468 start_codon:yes stop_codon:yes gene_type:complete